LPDEAVDRNEPPLRENNACQANRVDPTRLPAWMDRRAPSCNFDNSLEKIDLLTEKDVKY
jgi:hypothetical protein